MVTYESSSWISIGKQVSISSSLSGSINSLVISSQHSIGSSDSNSIIHVNKEVGKAMYSNEISSYLSVEQSPNHDQ